MHIVKRIINWFRKDNIQEEPTETIETIFNSNEYTKDIEILNINMDDFDDPVIINPEKRRTLLLLDDISESEILFNIDFNNIKTKTGYDIFKEFKIVKCYGKYAGFIAAKYLEKNKRIDYAILDITLGTSIKLANGGYKEYDGIDIGISILNNNKSAHILFLTAHTFNKRNPLMRAYFDKFDSDTDRDITEIYLNKNSDRVSRYLSFFNIKKGSSDG